MGNKKVFIIILLAVVSILTFSLIYKNVNMNNLAADSGFDSDWGGSDFGGSDFGGSDWSSSDWSSSDWSSSSSGSRRSYSITSAILMPIIVIVLMLLIKYIAKQSELYKPTPQRNVQERVLKDNKEALENIEKEIPNFDKEEFYDYVYKNFVDVQNAWMNFDYDALRKLVTDELFNTYKSQLKTLETKHQKNIMKDFYRSDISIIKYYKNGNKHNIVLKMTVRFLDYLVDKDNKVIRGTDRRRIIITYALTYVGSVGSKPNKCPNCNAPLDNNSSSNVCDYCRSTIVSDTHNFILAKKEAVEQRRES